MRFIKLNKHFGIAICPGCGKPSGRSLLSNMNQQDRMCFACRAKQPQAESAEKIDKFINEFIVTFIEEVHEWIGPSIVENYPDQRYSHIKQALKRKLIAWLAAHEARKKN